MLGLSGKTAVVTGASRGIGAAIATALAAEGASVVVNYVADRAAADAVVSKIIDDGGAAWALKGNVSKRDDVDRLYAEVSERHHQIDVLVNNAAIYEAGSIDTVSTEQFYRLYGVNVLGVLLSTQAALPLFAAAGGSIINISALSSSMASPNLAVYAGTKGAVDAVTLSLSNELGRRQIRVNAISPGAVETDGMADSGFLDAMKERVLASTPLGRLGQPDDIARIATFLASDASSWLTGQIIRASGGLTY